MLGPTMLRPFAWALMNTSRVATQNMRTVVEETLEWLGKNFYIKIALRTKYTQSPNFATMQNNIYGKRVRYKLYQL